MPSPLSTVVVAALGLTVLPSSHADASALGWHRKQAHRAVHRTHLLEDRLGVARTPWRSHRLIHRRGVSDAFVVYIRDVWRAKARRLRRELARPYPSWWLAEALCVHAGEGSWTANTGNGYYGGMQMDLSFQAAYGAEYEAAYGTADRWPARAQLAASYRAWRTRGWEPWPNTAAACGLL